MDIGSLLLGLAGLAWLAALGAVALVVFNSARGRQFKGGVSIIIGAVVAALALTGVSSGLVFIDPEDRGVVISALSPTGYRAASLGPGLHLIVPFAERVQTYTISRQTYTMSNATSEGAVEGDDSVRARTKDGQEVLIDASVIYAADPTHIVELHIAWQDRYEDDVVRPLSRGIVRDMASQYGVEQIVSSERALLEDQITQELAVKLLDNDLILVDFILRDIHFSDEYAAAVEQKQIAEQQAQQAAFVVEQRRQEAEQARVTAQGQADAAIIAAQGRAQATVLQAQAEAQSLALIGDALKDNPDVLTFRYIDKLAPNVQVMYLPAGQPVILPLPTPTVPDVPDVAPTSTAPISPTVETTTP
ncbi:MAG: prohibitin family protein [Anaerolineales bacterium]|nr:prohibitin family protein [Anaerolineales bacterium]